MTILKEVRPESDFEHSKDFLAEGLLDSFDIVALVAALDRHFNIAIDGVEIVPENFNTLEAIQKLLSRHGVQS
jgi:acyl carrier protein